MVNDLNTLKNLSLAEQLARVSRLWKTVVCNELAPLGLTQSRWTALWTLKRLGDNVSQKVLADALEIELGSLMRTLNQLEEQALILRLPSPHDKRARVVAMTEKGRQMFSQIESKVLSVRKQLLADTSNEELTILSDVLNRIAHNAHTYIDK